MRGVTALRHADLALLVLALPIFVLAELPLAGYVVGGLAWLAQRAIQVLAGRRSATALAAGDRRSAVGVVAASTLGRVWLVTIAVLLTGLLGAREDGLAAAVLCAALFTAYFAGEGLSRLLGGEQRAGEEPR